MRIRLPSFLKSNFQIFYQMNETKPKKGSKYAIMKDEDVHTITGSLKQFFREMKTDLIPIDIFHNLPNNLGNNCDLTTIATSVSGKFILETEESVKTIGKEINGIAIDSRMTLKYLLRHLVKYAPAQHLIQNAIPKSINK